MLGITVLPEYFQVEGVETVLRNCQEVAGATAITTSPYVMEISDAANGRREPPIDAGAGSVRLLDRPLWGKRELYMKTAPSFQANASLYGLTCYQPPSANEMTARDGKIVQEAITGIKQRDMEAFFQIQAAIPPGYRVQFSGVKAKDKPLLPNGKTVENRVALNASLASEDIFQYQLALMIDLLEQYPDVDGIRIDWPEYPPYRLDSVFLDFNPQVAEQTFVKQDYEFTTIKDGMHAVYEWLHGGLCIDEVNAVTRPIDLKEMLDRKGFLTTCLTWLNLKKDLVTNYIRRLREGMDSHGFTAKKLVPHAFPPPFNKLSGLDYGAINRYADHIPVKMYTMHWSMIARFYLDQLGTRNPLLNAQGLISPLFGLLNISDDSPPNAIEDVFYPGPNDAHMPTARVQHEKINLAINEAAPTPIAALIHAYGPTDDFRRRFRLAYNASDNYAWINRYCYLSDAKLQAIGEEVRHGNV